MQSLYDPGFDDDAFELEKTVVRMSPLAGARPVATSGGGTVPTAPITLPPEPPARPGALLRVIALLGGVLVVGAAGAGGAWFALSEGLVTLPGEGVPAQPPAVSQPPSGEGDAVGGAGAGEGALVPEPPKDLELDGALAHDPHVVDGAPRDRDLRRDRRARRARARAAARAAREEERARRSELTVARDTAREHFRGRRYGEAAAAYERAVTLAPRDAGAFAGLGAARLAIGDSAGAVAAYERAVALSPRQAGLHSALGRAYLRAGERERAVDAWRQALELDPGNRAARESLSRLGA